MTEVNVVLLFLSVTVGFTLATMLWVWCNRNSFGD